MRRVHFIELHEQKWMPGFLRESFVESLSVVLRITGVYSDVPPLYAEWLRSSGGREVLDLASGAAGPTVTLITDLQRMGVEPPKFCLSDLFPAEGRFNEARLAHPHHIEFIAEPVDALRVEAPCGRDLRQVISAFHHFKPDQARSIVEDAVRHSRGICILEPFQRDLLHLVIAALTIFPALIAPFFARRWKLPHFITSIVIPIVPLMLVFDAAVSVLRSYTRQEIERMIDSTPSDGFQWIIGSTRFMAVFRTTYVFGWKTAGSNP